MATFKLTTMKNILKIILVLVCATNSSIISAQETIIPLENQHTTAPPPNQIVYYKDVNNVLNKYVGTWKYENGTHSLTIQITKEEHASKGFGSYNDPNFEDNIVIKVFYKLNGVTKYTYQMGAMWGNNILTSNKIDIIYEEPTTTICPRKKQADLLLEFIPNGLSSQLKWERKNRLPREGKCDENTEYDSADFLIPENLTLTKQ